MGRADYLKRNDWNAACDRCGQKYKASDLRLEWDNLYVCPRCWEIRQPQDFVRATPDFQNPPWTRLMPLNNFTPPICNVQGRSCIAGFAVAGCMIAGLVPQGVYNQPAPFPGVVPPGPQPPIPPNPAPTTPQMQFTKPVNTQNLPTIGV